MKSRFNPFSAISKINKKLQNNNTSVYQTRDENTHIYVDSHHFRFRYPIKIPLSPSRNLFSNTLLIKTTTLRR